MAAVIENRKFEQLPHVENLGDYRPGGFHPVHIGDRLKGNKYTVLNKLGYGQFSTVWLAEEETTRRCVAVSILKAEDSTGDETQHIKMLRHLSKGDTNHPGRPNVLLPEEVFKVSGPNGNHFCVVTPVQGQSLSMVTKRTSGPSCEVLPLKKAKLAALGTILGFCFIHEQGIIHGDLHPGNLLLSLSEAETWTAETLSTICGPPRIVPLTRNDGLPLGDGVPRYGVEEAFGMVSDVNLYSGAIKVSDFGCAFFAHSPPAEIDFFGPYIVPEQFSTGRIGLPGDVWTLGCAIFLILSGKDIFGIPDDPQEKVFSAMMDTLGEPPEYMLEAWKSRIVQGLRVNKKPSRSLAMRIREMRDGNEELGMKARESEFSTEDIAVLSNLLSSMLVFEPTERLSMEAVVKHPAMRFFGHDI